MIFGKINYLNLLPFHVFMKRYPLHNREKMAMRYKGDVPAKINALFEKRAVDGAFISSVVARKYTHLNLGIVAQKEVKSVLVVPTCKEQKDAESATSNVLAQVLGVEGEVKIGDKALSYALTHTEYVDLAALWYERYNLPFVFALLSYHKHTKVFRNIERAFLKQPVKIPQYILHHAAKQRGLHVDDVRKYLELISYKVDAKAKKSLRLFYKKVALLS